MRITELCTKVATDFWLKKKYLTGFAGESKVRDLQGSREGSSDLLRCVREQTKSACETDSPARRSYARNVSVIQLGSSGGIADDGRTGWEGRRCGRQ